MSLLFSGNYFKNCFMKLTMTQGIFHITTHHGTNTHYTYLFQNKNLRWWTGHITEYQESCVQGKTSIPAVQVGPGKSPTENRTVEKTNSTVSLPLLSYQSTLHSDKRPREGESCCTLTILYVHQELWQQELLERYGNTISHLDTTRSSVLSCTKDKCWLFSGGRIF